MKKLVRPRRWSFIIFLFNPNFLFAQAPNNVCASTEALVYSGTAYVPATGNVANATIDGTVNTCNGTERYDVWYSFVAKSVYPTITLTNVGANFTNPGLQILYGGCNGASISCGTTSVKPTTLTVGLIITSGFFQLPQLRPQPVPASQFLVIDPPANDACANATLLTTASCNNGTIAASTADVGTACGNTVKYDVWYKFTATSTNPTISLKTLGSNFHSTTDNNVKARLQLFAACGGTSITCGGTSLTASTLTVGTTYYIRVYSITSNAIPTINGDFTICLTDPAPLLSSRMNEVFQQTTLSGTNLIDNPWEVIYGPDDSLWITEAAGYRVYKMDPSNGGRVTILELFDGASGYLTSAEHAAFNRGPMSIPQGGLAGMALHPDWASKKYVYLSYVHSYNSTAATALACFIPNSIVRFTYNPATRKLEGPVIICNTLPGSSDHNSQRMIIAPVGGTNYLFYAAGDMGSGQFGNAQRPINAQTINIYEGKILRFNLEPELAAPANDQWIPTDNPFNSSPVAPSARNAVWSLGIRNNQGFAFADGKLFGSSHGPYSDDEINVIDKEKNYGHPKVIGYAFDGNYNGSKAGHRNGNGTTDHPTSMPP
jgi:glucose/arabinose dehydrogenase